MSAVISSRQREQIKKKINFFVQNISMVPSDHFTYSEYAIRFKIG